MDLNGKSIVVTGGARGIGFANVRTLLDRGADVTFCARSEASVAEALGRLGDGHRPAAVAADVTTADGAEAVVRAALDRFGAIDGLVANAGLYGETPIGQTSAASWRAVLDDNLTSTFISVQAALPSLRAGGGAVVTIASTNGVRGIPGGTSAYGAAKAGVVNLTESLALELAPDVRVNCIAPGFIETEKLHQMEGAADLIETLSKITPAARFGRTEEIAHAVTFALENEFLVGATLNVDGGRGVGA